MASSSSPDAPAGAVPVARTSRQRDLDRPQGHHVSPRPSCRSANWGQSCQYRETGFEPSQSSPPALTRAAESWAHPCEIALPLSSLILSPLAVNASFSFHHRETAARDSCYPLAALACEISPLPILEMSCIPTCTAALWALLPPRAAEWRVRFDCVPVEGRPAPEGKDNGTTPGFGAQVLTYLFPSGTQEFR